MNEKNAENAEILYCIPCDFKCCKKSNYDKHLLTDKHKIRTKLNVLEQKDAEKMPDFICHHCQKTYKARNSLWYHKQKCNKNKEHICHVEKETDTEKLDIYDLVKYLMKENGELKTMMVDQQNMVLDVCQKIQPTNTVNSHNVNSNNKTFNLNVFLNETCKDAMNIMDFVDSIKLQLSDLENVGKLGYVEGISKIITSNLKALDITQRPIHCADKKRETMYIKDEDKWEKEDDNKKKFRKAIKRVATKNQRLIPKFKEEHPDCNKAASKFSDQYNKIIVESMGGSGDNDLEKEDKIIRNIAKEVTIDKSKY